MKRQAIVFFALSVALLVFYGIVGYLSLHARTSSAYRAYFIDKTRESMDDDGSWLRPVMPGQWIRHDSNDIGYVGFSGVEPEFRWSSGKRVSVLIDAACGATWRGVVRIRLSSNGTQRASFSLNGSEEVGLVVEPQQSEVQLQFPESAFHCGKNRLDIDLPDARRASERDSRVLGLAFREVTIE